MAQPSELSQKRTNDTESDTSAESDMPSGPQQASASGGKPNAAGAGIDFILDIPLEIRVELGRTKMLINELLKLGQGSVIELAKDAGENLEVLANNRLIAKGEVIVAKDKYGIRLTEIISPMERIEKLR